LAEHEFVAKTYSENEGVCEEIARLGYIEPTGKSIGMDPIYKLTQKFLI
jgi:hypothetical protein